MNTVKEFTCQEFEEFVQKNDLEVFSKKTIEKAIDDMKSLRDEFEKSCLCADFKSLTKAIVINDNLEKSIVFFRPSQVELKENIQEYSNNLEKSKNLVYKDTELNRFKGIVGMVVGSDEIEKARKMESIDSIKIFNVGSKPGKYIKTLQGWKPYKEEVQEKKKESEPKQKKGDVYKKQLLSKQIEKEKTRLVSKYGSAWKNKASSEELKKINTLISQLKGGK